MQPVEQGDLIARLGAAKQLRDQGRLELAEATLRALLAERPDFLQTRYELAVAWYHLGRFKDAIEGFAQVAAVSPIGLKSDEFYHALLALPDPNRAIAILQPLLPLMSGSLKLIEVYGRLTRKAAIAAGLPVGDIEVIGDSHAVTNFSMIPRCRVHWCGPTTMAHVTRHPIDLAALGITPGAKFVAVFGEIDCRCHLIDMARRMNTTVPALARRIARAFARSLRRTLERGDAAQAAICAVLPAPRAFPDNIDFPVVGSAAERRDAALGLNRALADAAADDGLSFLDICPPYCDAEGYLDAAMSDVDVHIDFRRTAPIATLLTDLFGPEPPGLTA